MAIDIKPDEVSSILKQQLKDFDGHATEYEVGTVDTYIGYVWDWG